MKVSQILAQKGREVWTIEADATILAALQLMAEKKIGALVVTDSAHPVGIFSERDYARKVVLAGLSSSTALVGKVMTPDPVCINSERTADECMALMTEKRIRHLPVVEDGKLAGIISIGDVVKSVIADREFEIQQLENYISGGG